MWCAQRITPTSLPRGRPPAYAEHYPEKEIYDKKMCSSYSNLFFPVFPEFPGTGTGHRHAGFDDRHVGSGAV